MTKTNFYAVCARVKKPLIRFCKGFKAEWLDEKGKLIKDYK